MEIELAKKVKRYLRSSAKECDKRGLQKASAWALEQIFGMNEVNEYGTCSDSCDYISESENDRIFFARSLFSSGEYQRCAQLLSTNNLNYKSPITSNIGIFIRCYAQYMSGEKLRDQKISESRKKPHSVADSTCLADATTAKSLKSSTTNDAVDEYSIKNSYLISIYHQLAPLYLDKKIENDGFLLYLFAVVIRDLHRQYGKSIKSVLEQIKFSCTIEKTITDISARQLFLESILVYPWNW